MDFLDICTPNSRGFVISLVSVISAHQALNSLFVAVNCLRRFRDIRRFRERRMQTIPFVQMALQTEKIYFRITYAFHSRYRYRRKLYFEFMFVADADTAVLWSDTCARPHKSKEN